MTYINVFTNSWVNNQLTLTFGFISIKKFLG